LIAAGVAALTHGRKYIISRFNRRHWFYKHTRLAAEGLSHSTHLNSVVYLLFRTPHPILAILLSYRTLNSWAQSRKLNFRRIISATHSTRKMYGMGHAWRRPYNRGS